MSFAENTSNTSPVPSAKDKRRDNFMASSLHKTLKLCSGEALLYKDNSVPLRSRNNSAVSILSQSLLQTTHITTQSTLKALVPCKGHSGPQCKSFWIEGIFHPRHTGLHRDESHTSRWFWWHWNYCLTTFLSSSTCFFWTFFLLEKKKRIGYSPEFSICKQLFIYQGPHSTISMWKGKQILESSPWTVLKPAIPLQTNQKHQMPLNSGASEIWITEWIKQIIFPSLISLAEHVLFSVCMAPGADGGHCVLL